MSYSRRRIQRRPITCWLGNAGSHFGVADIDDDDLLGGFELIEHVIERLYVKREARLKQIAKGLNKRKGKPVPRRRRFNF